MIFKLFVLLFTIAMFCEESGVQSKPIDCSAGELYWCRTRHTVRECHKEEYCAQKLAASKSKVDIAPATEDPKESLGNLFLEVIGWTPSPVQD